MKYLLLVIALTSCGRRDFDPIVDGNGGSAGTRLHDVYEVFETGPKLAIEQYDSLLDTRCFIYPTTSGLRCLPAMAGAPHYLDAACTQAAAPVAPDTDFFYDPTELTIDRIYAAGGDIATPSMSYSLLYDGTCAADPAPTGMWRSAAAVPFEMFAGLTRVLGAGTRLKTQQLVADDGFTTSGPLRDSQLDADCIAATYTDGARCEAYPATIAYFYTDAACSHVVVDSYAPVSYGIVEVNFQPCKLADVEERPVIADIDPMPLYVQIPGNTSCIGTTRGTGNRVLDLGAPLALAPLARQPMATGQRIEPIEDVAGTATAIEGFLVYDTQLAAECEPRVAADGVSRCLPREMFPLQTGYFSDAGCSVPLQVAVDNIVSCSGQPVTQFAQDLASMTHVYPTAAQYTGPLYSGTSAACSATTSNLPLLTLGAELPPSTFALVTEQTGP